MIKGLVDLVQSKPAITALISNRFYPTLLPQGLKEFPAVTYRWYSNTDTADFSGPSTYDFAYVDLQCYGDSYGQAVEIWEAMRKALDGESGTHNGVDIDGVWYMASGTEDYLEDLEKHTKQLELKVAYRRLQP